MSGVHDAVFKVGLRKNIGRCVQNGGHTHVAESEADTIIYELSLAMKFRASAKGIVISSHARSRMPYAAIHGRESSIDSGAVVPTFMK